MHIFAAPANNFVIVPPKTRLAAFHLVCLLIERIPASQLEPVFKAIRETEREAAFQSIPLEPPPELLILIVLLQNHLTAGGSAVSCHQHFRPGNCFIDILMDIRIIVNNAFQPVAKREINFLGKI
jgi:hypothetical protein